MKQTQEYLDYRARPEFSPSDLKSFASNIGNFYKYKLLQQEPPPTKLKKNTEIGKMVDMMLGAFKDFEKYYYIITEWKATEKVKDAVDKVMERVNLQIQQEREFAKAQNRRIPDPDVYELYHYDTYLMEAVEEITYYSNWPMASRTKSILEKGSEYFEQLKKAMGRTIISSDWHTLSLKAFGRCMDDKFVGPLCKLITGQLVKEGIEVRVQVSLFGTYTSPAGVIYAIKGLLDVVIINHLNKTIQVIDIKTCKYMSYFILNARLSRYDIQGDMYTFLVEQVLLPLYPGYTMKPFKFLAIPIEEERQPEMKELSPSDYKIARIGNGKDIKGWTQLLEEVSFHISSGGWEHYKPFYENGCIDAISLWNTPMELPEEILEVENLFS